MVSCMRTEKPSKISQLVIFRMYTNDKILYEGYRKKNITAPGISADGDRAGARQYADYTGTPQYAERAGARKYAANEKAPVHTAYAGTPLRTTRAGAPAEAHTPDSGNILHSVILVVTVFAITVFALAVMSYSGAEIPFITPFFNKLSDSGDTGGHSGNSGTGGGSPNAFSWGFSQDGSGANGSGGYTFTIAGTGETDVGPINFTRAGEYSYKLRHITGPRSGYTYDNEVYSLFINVTHDLTHTIVVYKNNGNKTADIKFEHSYRQYTSSGSKKPNVILPLERETTSEPATGDVLPYRRENKPSEPAQHTGDASPAPTEEPPLELTGPEQVEPYDPDWDIGDKNKPGDGTDVDRPPKAGDESRLELFTILLVLAGITAMISVVFLLTGRQRERVRREI